jgi:MFS family permease
MPAGLVNNLNDGMSCAILPIFFAAHGLGVEHIVLKAVYPAIWGVLQTVTGPLSDRWGRKGLIVWACGAGGRPYHYGCSESFRLVVDGKPRCSESAPAMVYPTLLAAISDASHPTWRARSLSIYRFWRDLGYAVGALLAGVIGDAFGLAWAIAAIGLLTFLSGLVTMVFMHETIATNIIE